MNVSRLLNTLTAAASRQATTRALGVLCLFGYLATLARMAVSGAGLQRWFFALLVWGVLVYIPLRIGLEAVYAVAPALRKKVIARTATRGDRYARRETIEWVVDGLASDVLVMPRIATPAQHRKVKDGAVAILARVRADGDAAVAQAALRCLATVERWVSQTASWSAAQAPQNIQARWAAIRALAALAGVARVLIAAFEDSSGRAFAAGSAEGARAVPYLDACLDFCDQLALDVDVVPWTEPVLSLEIAPSRRDAIRDAWTTYADTPSPAVAAREAFVQSLVA